jgi:hypothetical protein
MSRLTDKKFREFMNGIKIRFTRSEIVEALASYVTDNNVEDDGYYIAVPEYANRVRLSRQSIYKQIRVGTLQSVDVESAPDNRPIQLVKAVPRRKEDDRAVVLQERYLVTDKENEKE